MIDNLIYSGIFVLIFGALVLVWAYVSRPAQEPPAPYKIVFERDCYLDEGETLKLPALTDEEIQKLINRIRELPTPERKPKT